MAAITVLINSHEINGMGIALMLYCWGAQISFRVPPADVDLAYRTLQVKNIDVIEPPANQDWPHQPLLFSGPESNVLEIFADIHPDDTLRIPSGYHFTINQWLEAMAALLNG